MLGVGVAILLVLTAAGLTLALRRRPPRRPTLVASSVEPLPAGVKHLASTVSDLSDLHLHVPAASRALAGRRRLGVLLGLR